MTSDILNHFSCICHYCLILMFMMVIEADDAGCFKLATHHGAIGKNEHNFLCGSGSMLRTTSNFVKKVFCQFCSN